MQGSSSFILDASHTEDHGQGGGSSSSVPNASHIADHDQGDGSSSFVSNVSLIEDHGLGGGSSSFVSNDSHTGDLGQGGGFNSFVSKDSHNEDHGDVSVPDKLLCNICALEPLSDPVITSCGHLYCWPCLNESLENQSQKQCLACASPLIQSANFVKIYGSDLQPHDDQTGWTCRICLESPLPTQAVATSCGHIFCWPCLYEWLHIHYQEQGPCPVCRNVVERDVNILPVLCNHKVHAGNDASSNPGTAGSDVACAVGFNIPPRPSPPDDTSALSLRKYSTCYRFILGPTEDDDDLSDSVVELNFESQSDDESESDDLYEGRIEEGDYDELGIDMEDYVYHNERRIERGSDDRGQPQGSL